jgi:hypothetical protein
MTIKFTLRYANKLQRDPRELLCGHNQARHNLPHRLNVVIPGNGKGEAHRPTHVVDASQLLAENISDRFNFNGGQGFHDWAQLASLRTNIALLFGALKP